GYADFGQSNFTNIERRIQLGSMARTEGGKADGSHLGTGITGGWWFDFGSLRTGPFANVEWQTVKVNGYSESGIDSTAMWFGRQQLGRLAPRERLHVARVVAQEIADPLGIMLGQFAQPPCHGFLDEPFRIMHISRRPFQHPLADRQIGGLGVVLLGPGQGEDHGRATRPVMGRFGPGFQRVHARRIGQQAFLPRDGGGIRNRPAVKRGHP
ncbi:MAG: hypothetical protein B7X55_08845, partial [Rhodobacterales bacterium 34-62-10]